MIRSYNVNCAFYCSKTTTKFIHTGCQFEASLPLAILKKKKEKDLPYCLFFAIPFNEKSFVLLKKTKKQETTD